MNNIESRLKRLEEAIGVPKLKIIKTLKETTYLRQKIKTAHQYTIRNNFKWEDPDLINYAYSKLNQLGISKTRILEITNGITVSPLDLISGYYYVNLFDANLPRIRIKNPDPLYGGKDIIFNYITLGRIKANFNKKQFLSWENSLFDELELEVEKTKIPYSGIVAKRFLINLAEEKVEELGVNPTLFDLNPKAIELFEKWELAKRSLDRRNSKLRSNEDLDFVIKGTYKINSRGEIDVDGDVVIDDDTFKIQNSVLEDLGQFGKVTGKFELDGKTINSLKGCPRECGEFRLSGSSVRNLKLMPKKVNDGVILYYNEKLESFEGIPKILTGNFFCSTQNGYDFLDGFPKVIKGWCQFVTSKLTPEEILEVCNVKGKITTGYSF